MWEAIKGTVVIGKSIVMHYQLILFIVIVSIMIIRSLPAKSSTATTVDDAPENNDYDMIELIGTIVSASAAAGGLIFTGISTWKEAKANGIEMPF